MESNAAYLERIYKNEPEGGLRPTQPPTSEDSELIAAARPVGVRKIAAGVFFGLVAFGIAVVIAYGIVTGSIVHW